MKTKPKILAIDDAPVNLKTLVAALSDEYDLQIATSGERGLAYASASPPDLILLDVMMPGMDGYEVCRRLKADPRTQSVPVVFVTALTEIEAESVGLELGAVDYITKPINVQIARIRIHNHIEREHMRQELQAQRDEMARLARIDPLTGVCNRRYFFEEAQAALARALRHGDALSVLMVDIDHFKRVNDEHGHPVGDVALQQVSARCVAELRSVDVFGRLGGEEFAALLPRTDTAGAAEVAERIRLAVATTAIVLDDGQTLRLTVSVGVASLQADVLHHKDITDVLLSRADQALYQAKAAGRNRVQIHEPLPQQGTDPVPTTEPTWAEPSA
ncbi:MAG: diguanylate cyclase [Burkholderiales bacterium]|nr:diguanylate cyclase [Burkholderiales bacterium]